MFRRILLPVSRPVRLLLIILLFTVGLAVFIVWIGNREETFLQGSGIGVTIPAELQQAIASGEAFEPDTVDMLQFTMSMRLTPPGGSGLESSLLRIAIDDIGYFVYDTSAENQPDRVCIDHVRVGLSQQAVPDYPVVPIITVDLLQGVEPLCQSPEEPIDQNEDLDLFLVATTRNPTTYELYDNLYAEFPTYNAFRFFPYDSFAMDSVLQVGYRILEGETVLQEAQTVVAVAWLYETSGERNWNIRLTAQDQVKQSIEDTPFDIYNAIAPGDYQLIHMEFGRPLLFRLAYPILILAMVILIGLLPFIDSLDGLLEVTAAILFGIFGLRQVMTPPNSQGQTLLDVIFLGLYVVLAFALILIVVTRAGQRAERQRQSSESASTSTLPSAPE